MNQEILELREWIKKLKNSNKIILVEGKNDVAALRVLGIDNDIFEINKALFEVVEEIADNNDNKEIIILTDFDKKGKELYGKLKKDLVKHGCKIDHYFREFLQKNTKLTHIEGLPRYLERLK